MTRSILLALALAATVAAGAQSPTLTPEALLNGLAGSWEGALQYRDYQSNKLQEIPLFVNISATDDGATLIQRSTFQDPGFKVYSVAVSTIEKGTDQRRVAFFRDRKMETHSETVKLAEGAKGQESWTLVFEHTGEDDNRPARIRSTMTRDGARLTTEKEIDFQDDKVDKLEFRNRTVLSRGKTAQ